MEKIKEISNIFMDFSIEFQKIFQRFHKIL